MPTFDHATTPSGLPPDEHWDRIYAEKGEAEMSWTQAVPRPSLDLLEEAGLPEAARVIDVGGGTSRLVDHLLDRAFRPGVLDVSRLALERCRAQLGPRADDVVWIRSSILDYRASLPWDAWHDRAAFHFLVDAESRSRYVSALEGGLAPGGVLILATFAAAGPRRCSGLPTCRYDEETLRAELGEAFTLEVASVHEHRTPTRESQPFLYTRFRRRS